MAVRNPYLIEVYKSVAELAQFTPQLLMELKALDQASTAESQTEAFEKLFDLEKEFKVLRSRFEATYAKTRIVNKSENYVLDKDHHRHLANQKWNIYVKI
jgi:ABC-type enterochelin transport system substrate-binding protein